MPKIRKLEPNVVDQIAAGEVVDRPASVLKELLENAIDSGATKITVKVVEAGIKKIEVQDNGCGIEKEDLEIALDSHTTSKIETIEDLANVMTLGFRGEALSSIASVAVVTIQSMPSAALENHVANEIVASDGKTSKVSATTRDIGTTVRVENLFYNVPARHKFLKTPKTEYTKLLEVFIPIVIINPQIHFVMESDGKVVYNLPLVEKSERGMIHPQRLTQILKKYQFVNLFYDGDGVTVGGVVAHPKHHAAKVGNQYVFVNGRAIWDNGIAKAVTLGANRFIPDGHKVPFAVAINIAQDQVDVNVHPRKAEVRFANPYRVYSAVENAVKKAYESTLQMNESDKEFSRFRTSANSVDSTPSFVSSPREQQNFGQNKRYGVEQSLRFSRMLLADSGKDISDEQPVQHLNYANDREISARQFLGRYIIASFGEKLLIVDQHAAAERIRFEKLLDQYAGRGIEIQQILAPISVELDKSHMAFLEENQEIMKNLGYDFKLIGDNVEIIGVPSIIAQADHGKLFEELIEEIKDLGEISDAEGHLKDKYRDSIIATLACHSSVRMNQRVSDIEAASLVRELMKCRNSYSCPHGRPVMWELTKREIDVHFDRPL